MAPAIDACCLSLARPFPAKYALPPWETWRMMGALMSLSKQRVSDKVAVTPVKEDGPGSLKAGVNSRGGGYVLSED